MTAAFPFTCQEPPVATRDDDLAELRKLNQMYLSSDQNSDVTSTSGMCRPARPNDAIAAPNVRVWTPSVPNSVGLIEGARARLGFLFFWDRDPEEQSI
jgi:hypothetical protein